jgi:DNA repair protein RecN (Recombination protein N)
MLCSLRIKNLALVEDLALDFEGGFTVLTGETGAGKSLLVDALSMLLGAKGDSEVVRKGADRAVAEAVIDGNFENWDALLGEKGLPTEQPIVLRREVGTNGRSRAWINGSSVTLSDLREAGRIWCRLTSQHDHQSLLREDRHLGLFDEIIGIQANLDAEASAVIKAGSRLKMLRASQADCERRLEDLSELIEALEKLAPKPNEWSQLKIEREPLRHATQLEETWRECIDAFRGARPFMESAMRAFARASAILPDIQSEQDRMRSAMLEIDDLQSRSEDEFAKWSSKGADRLEIVEERLSRYERFARRHQCEPSELHEILANLRKERTELAGGNGSIIEMQKALDIAAEEYRLKAEAIHLQRQAAIPPLEKKVHKRLTQLGMESAKLQIRTSLCEDEESPVLQQGRSIRVSKKGFTSLTFWIEPNAGEGFRPLEKIASGGELSRLMLAMMGVGKGGGEGLTLVLDEVDVGLGGETAIAVGKSIRELGQRHQVLAVTHLAQVAAKSDNHGVLSKETLGGRTKANLAWIEGERQVRELARLLSGHPDSPEAQAHARSLLALRD